VVSGDHGFAGHHVALLARAANGPISQAASSLAPNVLEWLYAVISRPVDIATGSTRFRELR